MSLVREVCRRARDRAGALVRGARVLADYLRPGYPTAQPYLCQPGGHLITRLYRAQKTAIEACRLPPCPRRGCGGRLYATTWEREGRVLRAVLRQAAEVIACRDDGPGLIHTQSGGTPTPGGAAGDDDLREPTS